MKEYTKNDFKSMPREDFYLWIMENHQSLIGSAIFTANNSITSKIVRLAQKLHDKQKSEFIPSHTGSIIEKDGMLYLFDMKPPKAKIQSLTRYLLATKDDYILVLRDFPIDTNMFSLNILDRVNDGYAYMSAIRSVFTKLPSKYKQHCSEIHLRELQKQRLFIDVNKEITPNELLMLFRRPKTERLTTYIESEN